MSDYEKQKVDVLKDISKNLGNLVRENRKSNKNDYYAIRTFSGGSVDFIDEYDETEEVEDIFVIHKAKAGGYNDVADNVFAAACDDIVLINEDRLVVSLNENFINCPTCKNM